MCLLRKGRLLYFFTSKDNYHCPIGNVKYLSVTLLVDIYLFKVNNKNTRTMCEICSKLKIKTPERLH